MTNSENIWCEINPTGRLLDANNRFCRMFGFASDEIPWHYVKDLYRYNEEWETLKKHAPNENTKFCFFARLKNRAGRSFKCSVERLSILREGKWFYRLEIAKLDATSKVSPTTKVVQVDLRPQVSAAL